MSGIDSEPSRPGGVSRRSFVGAFASIAVGIPLLAACTPAAAPAPAATAKPAAGAAAPTAATASGAAATGASPVAAASGATPRAGGILKAGVIADFVTIDGHYYSPKQGLATWIIYDTMTFYDENLKVQPMLAESWEHSTDARQLKLNLRKGVTFHNGRELVADDVVYNFERVRDAKLTAGIVTNFIPEGATWEANDKYTVTIKSAQPWPAVFDFLEVVGITDKATMEGPDVKSKAIGTGPFTFTEWVQGDHLDYGKNKNYWMKDRPYLDGISVKVFSDGQSMTTSMEAGQIDLAMQPSLVDFKRLSADSKYKAVQMKDPPNFYMIQPNSTFAPLDNPKVRTAFAHAIDRKRIHETVLQGVGEVKSLPWPPSSPAYDASLNSTWAFDLDKAKALLAEAGASNLQLEMVFSGSNADLRKMAEIFQADLNKIGVKLDLRGLETGALLASWHQQTYKGFYVASDAWTNMQPVTYYTSSSVARASGNNGGYSNPEYTAKINALKIEGDEAKRKAAIADLNKFGIEQAIVLPIATAAQYFVSSAKVNNVTQRRIPLFKFTEAWMSA